MRKKFPETLPLHIPSNPTAGRVLYYLKPVILPVLLSVFPSLFHYGNNADILLLSSLMRSMALYGALALAVYLVILLINGYRPVQAANAAFVFLVFFNIYRPAYDFLLKYDVVQVEHYTVLPFWLLCAIYASWGMAKLTDGHSIRFWSNTCAVLGVLIAFNVIKMIPAEARKFGGSPGSAPVLVDENSPKNPEYPDIYYLVFDEFSGFEPMRQYWQYHEVDEFVDFLKDKGFFVAEESHGATQDTIYELATRLNYQFYPCCNSGDYRGFFEAIADSRVAQYLRAKGYQIVAFEESRAAFPSDVVFLADYLYEADPYSPPLASPFIDEFGMLVAGNTMLRAFSNIYEPVLLTPWLINHRNMVYFTVEEVPRLYEVSSPKFVYVHLLLPHMPFMFDADGNTLEQKHIYDWNYYHGNYIFTIKLIERMVNELLAQADPERPPIIILQSDHGARNQIVNDNENTLLPNFPEEYKTNIMFALYMPGYDTSVIPQDVKPINTFPIVFNHLFNADIPLE